eukprot:3138810-Ditylum_brightwellii.AAC.1
MQRQLVDAPPTTIIGKCLRGDDGNKEPPTKEGPWNKILSGKIKHPGLAKIKTYCVMLHQDLVIPNCGSNTAATISS